MHNAIPILVTYQYFQHRRKMNAGEPAKGSSVLCAYYCTRYHLVGEDAGDAIRMILLLTYKTPIKYIKNTFIIDRYINHTTAR